MLFLWFFQGFPQMIKAKDKPRQQEQTSTISRRQRDLERALDKEKNNNLQLHLQLKSAKEELQSVKTERKWRLFRLHFKVTGSSLQIIKICYTVTFTIDTKNPFDNF